ncbi:hypothetical protein K435DRAFT_846140 [Dendrothele bispora CBS 962.96]|uniref:Uncharacterized protein n=1 Tax=Dendrothele bispora (strain CBS 962.96) TaxID=1314807 RepID=A0A4S8KPG8_DENBC|nr:hypothetical protein K435DRAFT_846692 [Dendrothele bispora CBS 962.96]THU77567.1 hypothetical protein K435DRAFT_846140 [Dendrothele bispora CBS 962.96]
MPLLRFLAALASTGLLHVNPANGDSPSRETRTQYNINYRQMAAPNPVGPSGLPVPITSSSSYNYWWPYPPGGVYSTSSNLNPVSPVTTPLTEPLSLGIPPPSQSGTTQSTDVNTLNNTLSVSSSTIDSSQSFVTIQPTALSASPTSSLVVYPKTNSASQNPQKIMMYLIPVFAIVGLALGSGVAWITWGCLTRKPRLTDYTGDGEVITRRRRRMSRRRELDIGGPAYCPSLSEAEDATLEGDHTDIEKKSMMDDRGMVEVDGWHQLDDDVRDNNTGERDLEKAYLMPDSAKTSRMGSYARKHYRSRGLSRATTQKTATSVSVYSQVDDDDYDDEEEEEPGHGLSRNKSNFSDKLADNISFLGEYESDFDPRSPRFQHQIAETPKPKTHSRISDSPGKRTVSVSRRRTRPSGHIRADSDFNLDDVAASASPGGDLSRSVTSVTTRTFASTRTGPGFRIIEGSPLPTPAVTPGPSRAASPTGGRFGHGGFFWNDTPATVLPQSVSPKDRDSYTSTPQRNKSRNPTKSLKLINKSAASFQTPIRGRREADIQRDGDRSDGRRPGARSIPALKAQTKSRDQDVRRALPSSPPQVTSPKLADQLCFTP